MGSRGNGVESRVAKLERHIAAIEGDLAIVTQALSKSVPPDSEIPDSPPPATPADQVWACERCSKRIALYDPEMELLRIRYRDFVWHGRTGHGGMVRVVCRDCGHINQIEHVEDGDPTEDK